MIINISQKNIDDGREFVNEFLSCPIGLALQDMGIEDYSVHFYKIDIEGKIYDLPTEATKFQFILYNNKGRQK